MQFIYKGYIVKIENGILSLFGVMSGVEHLRKRIEGNISSLEFFGQYEVETYIYECREYQENYTNSVLRSVLTGKQYSEYRKEFKENK